MPEYPQQPPDREEELAARAEKIGYALYPPTADRWLLTDKTGGWLTFGSLDEVNDHLEAEEEGNEPGDEYDPFNGVPLPPHLR